jgi:hypothetical protein
MNESINQSINQSINGWKSKDLQKETTTKKGSERLKNTQIHQPLPPVLAAS